MRIEYKFQKEKEARELAGKKVKFLTLFIRLDFFMMMIRK